MEKILLGLLLIAFTTNAKPILSTHPLINVTANTKQSTKFWIINPEKCTLEDVISRMQKGTLGAQKQGMDICAGLWEGYEKYSKYGYEITQTTDTKGSSFSAPQSFIIVGFNANGWAACQANKNLEFYTGNKATRTVLKGGELMCK